MADMQNNIAEVLGTQLENIVVAIIEFIRDFGVLLWYVFCRPDKAAWTLLYLPDRTFPKCRPIPALFVAVLLFITVYVASMRPKASAFDFFNELGNEMIGQFSVIHALWSTIPTLLAVTMCIYLASLFVPARNRAKLKAATCYIIAAQTAAFLLVLLVAVALLAGLAPQLSATSLKIFWLWMRIILATLAIAIVIIPCITYFLIGMELSPKAPEKGIQQVLNSIMIVVICSIAFLSVVEIPRVISTFRWHKTVATSATAPAPSTQAGTTKP